MLSWISSFFKKEPEEFNGLEATKRLTLNILRHIQKNRVPLTITFSNSEYYYLSTLLDIDTMNDQITIDEVFPQDGHHRIVSDEPFFVSTRSQGVYMGFQSIMQSHGHENNIAYYVLPIPDEIEYKQRREVFRVPVPKETELVVSFIILGSPSFRGHIQDLSLSGMQIVIPRNLNSILTHTNQINDVHIALDKSHTIQCNFKVCHSHYEASLSATVIGCEFVDMDKHAQREIAKLVAHLQRTQRQQESRFFS